MTNAEIVHRIKLGAMKCRSTTMESGLGEIAKTLNPWLFGENNILRAVEIVEGREISLSETLNLLTIANLLEPSIAIVANISYGGIPTVEEYMQKVLDEQS